MLLQAASIARPWKAIAPWWKADVQGCGYNEATIPGAMQAWEFCFNNSDSWKDISFRRLTSLTYSLVIWALGSCWHVGLCEAGTLSSQAQTETFSCPLWALVASKHITLGAFCPILLCFLPKRFCSFSPSPELQLLFSKQASHFSSMLPISTLLPLNHMLTKQAKKKNYWSLLAKHLETFLLFFKGQRGSSRVILQFNCAWLIRKNFLCPSLLVL